MKENHTNKTAHTPASTSEHSMDLPKKKRPIGKIILIILLVILLMAGSLFLGYWYRDRKAKEQAEQLNQQITELQTQKQTAEDNAVKIQKELDELKAAKSTTTTNVPTAAVKENVIASITSGNTAALEGYMANPVKVVIAASGGVGDRTPAQAVSDIVYIKDGTAPWNFNLPAATLAAYRASSYGQYFPTNAIVGKSANNYVISFSFNSAGKISTVFMANNAALITD